MAPMKKAKIYKIVNNVSNKVYIGCTIYTLEKRFNEHLYRCFISNNTSKLYNSMRKYGKENFTIELVEECEIFEMFDKEKNFIVEYNSFKCGLNSTLGGEGCLGYKHSDQIRKKISIKTREGNSHKNKTYEKLYGDKSEIEKEKRRETVKKYWENLSEEEKNIRTEKLKQKARENSKYSLDFVKKIKNDIKNGIKITILIKQYPDIRPAFFYEIRGGRRWGDI